MDFEVTAPAEASLGGVRQVYRTFPVGEIFQSDILFTGLTAHFRSWHLLLADATMGRREQLFKIYVRYEPVEDVVALIVNGELKFRGTPDWLDKTLFRLAFTLAGNRFELKGLSKGNYSFDLSLTMNERELLKEVRESAQLPNEDETLPQSVAVLPIPKLVSINGKTVAYFIVVVQLRSGQTSTVMKRFSDFANLHFFILGQISAHMRRSLPSLPPKVYNPFFNQLDKQFLESRRLLLEKYLTDVLHHGKANCLTDWLCFLGLHPVTCAALAPQDVPSENSSSS